MRPTYLLLAIAFLGACDDGKIDLDEYEDGSEESDEDSDGSTDDSGGNEGNDDDSPDDTGTEDSGTAAPVETGDEDEDGFTGEAGDCNDSDPNIHPGARERCDDIDHDCDGMYYNNILVRYDISISQSWNDIEFPSAYPTTQSQQFRELWHEYRDFDTDKTALSGSAWEHTGNIRPLVLQGIEMGDEPFHLRREFTHDPGGRVVEEVATSDGEGGLNYTYDYLYFPEGWLQSWIITHPDDDPTYGYFRYDYTYDETGRVLTEHNIYVEGGEPGTIRTYIYDDELRTTTEEVDNDGSGVVDYVWVSTHNEDGQLLLKQSDWGNDGTWDTTMEYTYDDFGRKTAMLGTYLAFDAGGVITRTDQERSLYEYNADGNLTFESFDSNDDGILEEWTRNTYEDRHLTLAQVGTQTDEGIPVDDYNFFYERDIDGRWTSRTTTSFVEWMHAGIEYATYNADGRMETWDWEHTDAGSAGFMTTGCLGPPNPETIESF